MQARLASIAALALLFVSILSAQWLRADDLPLFGVGTTKQTTVAYQGPADIVASPVICYSLYACSAALAASNVPMVALNNGTNTCNILAATTGGLGVTSSSTTLTGGSTGVTLGPTCNAGQTVAGFCAAGSFTFCKVAVWFNQMGTAGSGAGALSQSTGSSQPTLTASQLGTSYGITANGTVGGLDGNSSTGVSGSFSVSMSIVGRQVTVAPAVAAQDNDFFTLQLKSTFIVGAGNAGGNNGHIAYQSTANIFAAAVGDTNPHVMQVVCNGSAADCDQTPSTTLYLDNATGVTGATSRALQAGEQPAALETNNSGTICFCAIGEAVVWSTPTSSGNVTALYNNTHTRWGF